MVLEIVHDRSTGRAVVVGNAGMADLQVVVGTAARTFLEHLPTGAVQTTTVAHDGSAVHSRNTYLTGIGLSPSQRTGDCAKN